MSTSSTPDQRVKEARDLLLEYLRVEHSPTRQIDSQLSELTDQLEDFFKNATPHQTGKCVVYANDLISIYEKIRNVIGTLGSPTNLNTAVTLENILERLNEALGESNVKDSFEYDTAIEPELFRYSTLGVERSITIEQLAGESILERARLLASDATEFLTGNHQVSSDKLGLKKLVGLMPRAERLFVMSSHQAILLVDDDSLIRDAVTRKISLELPKVNVTTCETGGECLDLLQNIHPTKKLGVPRLVFLDLTMPGLNGLEVLEKIRNTQPIAETLVFILTAHPDPYFHRRAQQIGCSGIINKSEINTQIKMIGRYLMRFQAIN